MIWGIVAIVLPLVGWGVFASIKWASAASDRNAAADLFRAQCRVSDELTIDRDRLAVANVSLTKQVADQLKALSDADARIATLAQKVVKLTTAKLETATLEDGAAAVNSMFSKPLQPSPLPVARVVKMPKDNS